MADKAKQVAFTDIQPVFEEVDAQNNQSMSQVEENRRRLLAFRLSIEGPQRDVNYFSRLISEANLIQPNQQNNPSVCSLLNLKG